MCDYITSLQFNVLLNIIDNFRHTGNVICKFNVNDIMSLLACCRTLWQYRNNDNIWYMICSQFTDFNRLRAIKIARNTTWQDLYIGRLKNLLHEKSLVVGDPDAPEYTITIYIYGNGHCYISKVNREVGRPTGDSTVAQIVDMCVPSSDSDISDSEHEFEVMRMVPIEKYKHADGEHYHEISEISEISEIIDAHAANSTVLLLCQSGKVLEMMFTPSWITNYDQFHIPTLVIFPDVMQSSEYIIMVRTLSVGNFAVSNVGKVFVWTIFDHPVTMKKIRTEPIYLQQLQNVLMNIYDVQDTNLDHHTRICYHEPRGRNLLTGEQIYEDMYIDIANDQIMMLIMEKYFSAEDVDEISHTINAGGNPA